MTVAGATAATAASLGVKRLRRSDPRAHTSSEGLPSPVCRNSQHGAVCILESRKKEGLERRPGGETRDREKEAERAQGRDGYHYQLPHRGHVIYI